jgi:tetratricopeptide (TPR) repeat protein
MVFVFALSVAPSWAIRASITLTVVAVYLIYRWKYFTGLRAVRLSAWDVNAHTIAASRFILVDAKGKTRAYLGFATGSSDEPGPRLILYNALGKDRLELRVMDKDDSTEVTFYSGSRADEQESGSHRKERLQMRLTQDAFSAWVSDPDGPPRVQSSWVHGLLDECKVLWSTRLPQEPLQAQILTLLAKGVSSQQVHALIAERGVDFIPSTEYLEKVRSAGGDDEVIGALIYNKWRKPVTVDLAAQVRQAEAQEHADCGDRHYICERYSEAEKEYRAGLRLDSQNVDLYVGLARVLIQQSKLDDALTAGREAVRLNPNNGVAHSALGEVLAKKGDWGSAVAEYREVARLDPLNTDKHYNLGLALGNKEDWDGAIGEYRQAIRCGGYPPRERLAVGRALAQKGDLERAISEYREVVRQNPNEAEAHFGLGTVLEKKGKLRGALEEYCTAYKLVPKSALYKKNYKRLSRQVN